MRTGLSHKTFGPRCWQRAEVFQSMRWFFAEQQQSKQIGGKVQKVDSGSSKPPETLTDPPGQEKAQEKPSPAPTIATKPVRTGPVKPQAIKMEETKSQKCGLLQGLGEGTGERGRMKSDNASSQG